MKFSENWLREWVNPNVSTDELAAQLTMAGLEVDAVEAAAGAFAGVVVAAVLDVVPHPDADKLRVCQVDAGTGETLQIVCGAPNVCAGMKVPAALVGAVLPGDLKIKKAKLRGVESSGMLCSARELGLADDHAGLMALPANAPIGADIRGYLNLNDAIIEVDFTPNRGDCLGVAGLAREIAVLNRATVTAPAQIAIQPGIADQFPIRVVAPEACPRYLGRVIRGIDPQAITPLWMREKLRRGGIRSLGPLVDVTNYILLELGQPMHAFDLARLHEHIEVRYARAGEAMRLLGGRDITLDSETLVIADASKVLAIAGVMGGDETGVGETTRDLFLECAFFAPDVLAGRARRYGLQTDSSYRFERGVDFNLQRHAMERATELLLELVGGTPGPITEVCHAEQLPKRAAIRLRHTRVRRLLGIDLPNSEIEDILNRLGADLQPIADGWEVVPPSYRFDMALEADLIEDIGRIHGYNRLPSTRPKAAMQGLAKPEERVGIAQWREILVQRGYQEAITYSFVEPGLQAVIDPHGTPVTLANPISSEMSVMRTSLWPGLLKTAQHNLNRQQARIRLFEYGLTYVSQHNDLKQEYYVSGLACGSRLPEQWGVAAAELDFFDIKADVEALLMAGGCAGEFQFISGQHAALHPGQTACIQRQGLPVGWLGMIHPELAKLLEIPEATFIFEIASKGFEIGSLPVFQEISRYPAIRRDLAFILPQSVVAADIYSSVRAAAGPLLQDLSLFDLYQGKAIESGRKSIALGLILQDSSRTLTEQDVEAVLVQVQTALNAKFGATLRE
ncbi:MAG: phenylalanine--tRNA ligase subunit beta [Gammaproteobacteria bacterium]|nr:phenylalanine--tRNA ligase subunit beta [Gammaproteobacteria bacterium]